MKYTQALAKMAALGWKQDGTNITNRFADFDNEKLAQTAAAVGVGVSSQGGIVGALAGYGAGKALTAGKRPDVEELPDFDPETGAYIGKSYAVPDTEEDMQKLHQRITGTAWEASAPEWLEWLLQKRKERIRNAIVKVLKDGKGNTEGMSHGEIASLVFPHVYKNDGTVAKNLGFWKWKDLPVKGAFKSRPISMADIQEYEKEHEMRKQAFKPQWDPNGVDLANTDFAFQTTQVDKALKDSLVKHYGSLLAKAYKESTGKVLKNPQQHIDPRYSYIIGRAANVNPEILDKLNDFYYQRLGGWQTTGQNVDPGLVLDAADLANKDSGVYPLNYRDHKFKRDSKYVPGVKVKAELVNR